MRLVSWDLETHLVQPGLLCPPIVCSAMATPGMETTLHKWPTGLAPLKAELQNPANTFVGANIAYDFGCLLGYKPELIDLVWGIYSEGRVFDVQIAAMLNAIYDGRTHDGELYRRDGSRIQSGRYSLHECVKEWLQRDDAKHNDRWRLSYALLETVPMDDWPKDAIQYPIDDAENTLQVAQAQLAGAKNLHDMKVQAHAAFCMHLGAIWGIRTSAPRVQALTLNVNTKLEELRSFAKEQGFMRPDGTKNKKAIMSRVTQAYDAVPPTTEKGSVSTERQVLENSGDEVLVKFSEISKWEKVATYLPAMEEASKAPMNVRSNPLLATGRASYEGLIQLLPRKGGIRECFAARPGTAFVSVDYAAIEMATLAQVCLWTVRYSNLAEALNKGLDPHSMLAAKLKGVPYEHFMANMDKELRQAAKAADFGFPGLMSEATFVTAKKREGASVCEWLHKDGKCGEAKSFFRDDLECVRCVDEAKKLRKGFLSTWTEIRPYWNWVVARKDSLEHFVSKRVRGGLRPSQAANSLFQGLAADGAKRAVIALTEEMYTKPDSPLYNSRLVMFTHDETIIEAPLECLHEAAKRQTEIMLAEMKKVVPDVRVSAAPAAMLYLSKDAESVYDKAGRLVPWDREKQSPSDFTTKS